MKNLSLFINFVLLIAVVVLFYLQFSKKESSTAGNNTTNTKTIKNVFVNTDTLQNNYLYLKDMRDELAAEKLKLDNQFNTELKKLENEAVKLQGEVKYMTQTQIQQKQLELAQKEQGLMQLEQQLTTQYRLSEQEKLLKVQQAIKDYLKVYSQNNDCNFIFGYNGWGNLLFAKDSLDITAEVLKAMNENYTANKISE